MSKYISYFAIIASITVASLSCCLRQVKANTDTQANMTYRRVLQSGIIRCGYFLYPPYCMINPNTNKLTGIFVEIAEEAAQNLGLKIDWTEEVGAGTMIEGLRTNRYDLVPTGVWPNASRGKYASFSIPLFYIGLGVFVRSDDNRFNNNLRAIDNRSIRISMIDGQIDQAIAERQFPHAGKLSHPNMSDSGQLLLDVASKKADLTFAEPGIASIFLAHNPGTLKNITEQKPLAIFANTMMFKIGEPAFKSMLDTALTELINNGFVDEVLRKYEAKPSIYLRVAPPYQLASTTSRQSD